MEKNVKKDKESDEGKQKKGLYVRTTKRNYLIEVYSVLGMTLFLIIVALLKGKILNIPNAILFIFILLMTFKMVQYILTKKSISYWRGDFWIEEKQDAKIDAIINLLCLLLGLLLYLLS